MYNNQLDLSITFLHHKNFVKEMGRILKIKFITSKSGILTTPDRNCTVIHVFAQKSSRWNVKQLDMNTVMSRYNDVKSVNLFFLRHLWGPLSLFLIPSHKHLNKTCKWNWNNDLQKMNFMNTILALTKEKICNIWTISTIVLLNKFKS